ncbi:MAG: hypothetical protein ACREU7_03370, partial [Burkholderiales bacterium]
MAAAAVLLAAVAGSIGPVREAVADLFDRINVFETDEPITGLPTEIPGREVTLAQAEAALGFKIRLPSEPEELEPERILLQEFELEYGPLAAAILF